ncbi:MAG: ankyrin repeat domain-containing protein [Hyphomicrobiales bacterium]
MRTDWHQAALDGDGDTIARLIAEGATIDSLDRHGQTALMLAAVHGHDEVVRVLVSNGADMDVTAKFGLSALMLAVINLRTDIAAALVDAGADISVRGRGAPGFAGKTARHLATDRGLDHLADHIAAAERRNLDT